VVSGVSDIRVSESRSVPVTEALSEVRAG
jgi:hypothetical protein